MKQEKTKTKSVFLENLTWVEAEKMLEEGKVLLIGLGARLKEHGPHLPLNNDFVLVERLLEKVIPEVEVLVLPTLQYGYYPAFLEYPGSVSLKEETFKNMIVEICESFIRHGAKKFYILNTGISTLIPLARASEIIAKKGGIIKYLDLEKVEAMLPEGLLRQEGGSHADESETSMMLYLAPSIVDMSKAVKEYDPKPNTKRLSREPSGSTTFSATGIWGDPTLATMKKGEVIVNLLVKEIVKEIRELEED